MRLQTTVQSTYVLVSAGALLIGVVAVSTLLFGPSGQQGFMFLVLLFSALVAGLIVYRRLQGEFDWFEPGIFTAVVYLVFFGLAGLPFIADPMRLHPFLLGDRGWLTLALFYVILGVIVFWFGYYGRLGLVLHRLSAKPGRESLRSQATIRLGVVVGLYGVGLAARLLMLRLGLYGYLRDPEHYVTVPYAEFLVRLEAFTLYALVLAWLDSYSRPLDRLRRWLAVFVVLFEMLWGFFSGMKINVILPILLVGMVYTYKRGRLPVRAVATAILLVLVIYPVNTVYRQMLRSGGVDVRTPQDMVTATTVLADELVLRFDDPTLYLGSGYESTVSRASMIQNYALLLKYLDHTGAYWHGRSLWQLPALIAVPRALWPEKPVFNMGYWFGVNVWGQDPHVFSSVAITYPGDLHLQFGLPSLLLGMYLTGIAFRWLYERYARPGSNCSLFIYIFVFYQLVAHEADLAFKVSSTVRVFLIVFVISLIAFRYPRRVLQRAPAGSPPAAQMAGQPG